MNAHKPKYRRTPALAGLLALVPAFDALAANDPPAWVQVLASLPDGLLVMGVILLTAALLANPWHAWVVSSLNEMPPTAAGPGGLPPQAAAVLLTDADAEGRSLPPQAVQKGVPGRARHAGVDFKALEAESIELNLFDNENRRPSVTPLCRTPRARGSGWVISKRPSQARAK